MKKSGVALLATIISIAVLLLVSGGFFTIMASNTGLIKSSGESLQAQYFAQLEADIIKMLSYDEVDNITQDTWQEFDIDNSWQYKVNVGPEQNVGDSDNTMKIASISVRKSGDTIDRFALDVPLSSQGGSHGGVQVDYTKPMSISYRSYWYDDSPHSMVAPSNGVVVVSTTSYSGSETHGNSSTHRIYGYTYCSISGYGTVISGNGRALFLVNKGATILLGEDGNAQGHVTAGATFYPYK